jgi:hypothetical protein
MPGACLMQGLIHWLYSHFNDPNTLCLSQRVCDQESPRSCGARDPAAMFRQAASMIESSSASVADADVAVK